MGWVVVLVGLLTLTQAAYAGEPQTLTSEEPVVQKVRAKETLQFRLSVPPQQRGIVTLVPLDGDADLFVLLPPETLPTKTPYKSTNVALQTEQVLLPRQAKETEAIVQVVGITDTRFLLSVRWTALAFVNTPEKPSLVEVRWQEVGLSNDILLGALTVLNRTNSWYEVRLKPAGPNLSKVALPTSFVLGPKGERYLGWVAVSPADRLQLTVQRSQRADAFLVADCVSRVVAGVALSPNAEVAIDDLLPQLKPLFPVAQALREGDWKRAGALLLAALRRYPQTLTALHTFLQRAGIRIPRDIVGSRMGSGFGAISAIIMAMSVVHLPKEEQVTVTVRPVR